MDIDQAWNRYHNDLSFNQLVDMLYRLIHNMHFTYGDLRDAAFLARVQVEEGMVR